MAIVLKTSKQPAEVQDYDIDFSPYLDAMTDTITSASVTAETGISLDAHSHTAKVVKFWLSGGEVGQKYKITVRITTAGGRVKEDEAVLSVKEF